MDKPGESVVHGSGATVAQGKARPQDLPAVDRLLRGAAQLLTEHVGIRDIRDVNLTDVLNGSLEEMVDALRMASRQELIDA